MAENTLMLSSFQSSDWEFSFDHYNKYCNLATFQDLGYSLSSVLELQLKPTCVDQGKHDLRESNLDFKCY